MLHNIVNQFSEGQAIAFMRFYNSKPRVIDLDSFLTINDMSITLGLYIDFMASINVGISALHSGYCSFYMSMSNIDVSKPNGVFVFYPIASKQYDDIRNILDVYEECIVDTLIAINNPIKPPF